MYIEHRLQILLMQCPRHHQAIKNQVWFSRPKEKPEFSQKPIEWLKANKNIEIKHFLIFLLRSKKNTLIQSKTITFFLIGSKIIFNFYFTVLTFLAFSINSYPTFFTGEFQQNRLTFPKTIAEDKRVQEEIINDEQSFGGDAPEPITFSRLRILYAYILIWITE